ncbi:MAG: Na(+)/H(+) antiporter subunit B [Methylococcales bacterium]|jgi:multicomponent Na+:H+ antiporter subunit B|nr:Na(+)/H(+) antiporter subunit B [Methylococcales bacterium]MBT7445019.1 Na(+)/H(+) antiporter subunit B [Methylococcales bacterium]
MLKKFFAALALFIVAIMFYDIASNYQERQQLSGVAQYYVEKGPSELGAANLVTSVVVTYRGLDTLGEVTVLFISAAGIGLLLRRQRDDKDPSPQKDNAPCSEIVDTAFHLLFPMILLFGIYIFVNGHLTPGGGFQGGAVIASGMMLYLLAKPNNTFNLQLLKKIESFSGSAYVLIGALGLFLAGGFLDNRVLSLGEFGSLFSAGLIPVIYVLIGLKVGAELSSVLTKFRDS